MSSWVEPYLVAIRPDTTICIVGLSSQRGANMTSVETYHKNAIIDIINEMER